MGSGNGIFKVPRVLVDPLRFDLGTDLKFTIGDTLFLMYIRQLRFSKNRLRLHSKIDYRSRGYEADRYDSLVSVVSECFSLFSLLGLYRSACTDQASPLPPVQ